MRKLKRSLSRSQEQAIGREGAAIFQKIKAEMEMRASLGERLCLCTVDTRKHPDEAASKADKSPALVCGACGKRQQRVNIYAVPQGDGTYRMMVSW